MRLVPAQQEQFHRDGYLFFPGLFTPAEVRALTQALPGPQRGPAGGTPAATSCRAGPSAAATPPASSPFARLAHHPRLVEPVEDLLGGPPCIHRFKVRGAQAAFDGEEWPCPQDFGGPRGGGAGQAPGDRVVNVAIFLDDCSELGGPLMFIPGSHRRSGLDAYRELARTSYPAWTLDYPLIGRAVARAGVRRDSVVAPKGPAGSMIVFHARLVPAAGGRQSPFGRAGVQFGMSPAEADAGGAGPAAGDRRPIECLPDDCLLKDYPAELPWQDHGSGAARGLPAAPMQGSAA
jgi:ectoine hydroxylase